MHHLFDFRAMELSSTHHPNRDMDNLNNTHHHHNSNMELLNTDLNSSIHNKPIIHTSSNSSSSSSVGINSTEPHLGEQYLLVETLLSGIGFR